MVCHQTNFCHKFSLRYIFLNACFYCIFSSNQSKSSLYSYNLFFHFNLSLKYVTCTDMNRVFQVCAVFELEYYAKCTPGVKFT